MITDAQRRHLHTQAEHAMDEEAADTLMNHLPPVGWQDMASKTDVDNARTKVETKIDNVRTQLVAKIETTAAQIRQELATQISESNQQVIRAYYIGTGGIVIGMSTVPQIAERIFGG